MKQWTLADIRSKIEAESDLEDEDFIRTGEFTDYVNEAIEEAAVEIQTLYQDYYLDSVEIAITPGDEKIDLPSGIYAHKIRRVIFIQNQITRAVKRIGDWKKFEQQADESTTSSSMNQYRYYIVNPLGQVPKMLLVPKSTEVWTMRVWFIRSPNYLLAETDILDIPFPNFVFAFLKVKVQEKEGHPGLGMSMQTLERRRQQMLDTLSNMVPDADNDVEADLTSYEDMN